MQAVVVLHMTGDPKGRSFVIGFIGVINIVFLSSPTFWDHLWKNNIGDQR